MDGDNHGTHNLVLMSKQIFHIEDGFRAGQPVSAIGADWFNKVAGFLNSLVGGLGISITKNASPSVSAPVSISIDPDAVRSALAFKESEYSTDLPDTPVQATSSVPAAHQNNAKLTTTWTRGNRDGVGVKIYLPTDSWDTGVRRMLAWRLCEFDRYGCLQKVNAQTILTDAVSVDQLN